MQVGVNLGGAVSLWVVAIVAAWYSNKGKRSQKAKASPPRPEASPPVPEAVS
jgi:hypothetical protein